MQVEMPLARWCRPDPVRGRGRGRGRGFTLIEAMVVGLIALLLAGLAAPSFVAWQVRDRAESATRALLAALAFARSEAIRRGEPIVVCRRDPSGRCLSHRSVRGFGAADWAQGWAIVTDTLAGASLLRMHGALHGVVVRGAANHVRFTPPAGQVIGGFRSFEIVPSAVSMRRDVGNWRWCVSVAAGGRAQAIAGGCGKSP